MYQNLPQQIQLVEVGPRDGFQNVKDFIATEDKIAIIEALIEAGISHLELTSFVSPKAIPQLADATIVCQAILDKYSNAIHATALVPNTKGAQAAWNAGIREAACVISVSQAHNLANINRTHEQSLQELANTIETLPGMKVRVSLATAFACPFTGWVQPDDVLSMIASAVRLGVRDITLCDTIGVATPDRVFQLAAAVRQEYPAVTFALHLHDTRGMGLVNTIAGLQAGIVSFETSVGGLGGCPFAPGAAGNTATEDVVNMLADMSIETRVDLSKLLTATDLVAAKVNAPLTGHLGKAKLYDCFTKGAVISE